MANRSAIEWTSATWNPITGCTKVSPGCKNCYAERMAKRLKAMGQPNYANGFALTLHEHALGLPERWRSPRLVFVNSMSDLFHERVPLDFIVRVFDVMNRADWHQYQVLTKRSARLLDVHRHLEWREHLWMGVSVENRDYTHRIDHLRRTGAHVKFLSLEPLLGSIGDLDLEGIDWVIVGGESGPRARPMEESWACEVRDQCLSAGIPFFFKQWGGVNRTRKGRVLQGRTWDEIPVRKSHVEARVPRQGGSRSDHCETPALGASGSAGGT